MGTFRTVKIFHLILLIFIVSCSTKTSQNISKPELKQAIYKGGITILPILPATVNLVNIDEEISINKICKSVEKKIIEIIRSYYKDVRVITPEESKKEIDKKKSIEFYELNFRRFDMNTFDDYVSTRTYLLVNEIRIERELKNSKCEGPGCIYGKFYNAHFYGVIWDKDSHDFIAMLIAKAHAESGIGYAFIPPFIMGIARPSFTKLVTDACEHALIQFFK